MAKAKTNWLAMAGIAVGALVLVMAYRASLKSNDPKMSVQDVYAECLAKAPDFARADANLARQVERACHAEQAAAYANREP